MQALTNYIRGSIEELRRVVWPTRQQAIALTGLVLVFATIMAIYLSALDLIWRTGLERLLNK